MKSEIKAFAASLGMTESGVTALGDATAFVCLFPYFSGFEAGNLSVYAYSTDYHLVTREKLGRVCEFMKTRFGAERAESFADIGPDIEKDLAHAAGLGFYGKNRLLINPRLGSYFFIGYVLTDLKMEPDSPLEGSCLGCGRCVAACPGHALDNGFDPSRCASAISQKKGNLSDEEADILRRSGYAFGCDVCQKVCPHNSAPPPPMPEFTENRIFDLKKSMFDGLTNREFREKYGNYAFAWRGKAVLIRNIEILNE